VLKQSRALQRSSLPQQLSRAATCCGLRITHGGPLQIRNQRKTSCNRWLIAFAQAISFRR